MDDSAVLCLLQLCFHVVKAPAIVLYHSPRTDDERARHTHARGDGRNTITNTARDITKEATARGISLKFHLSNSLYHWFADPNCRPTPVEDFATIHPSSSSIHRSSMAPGCVDADCCANQTHVIKEGWAQKARAVRCTRRGTVWIYSSTLYTLVWQLLHILPGD